MPVLASLRAAWPDARIDWLVQDSFADAVRGHHDLTGVVGFDRRGLGRAARRLRIGEIRSWIRTLREPGYDLVIDAQGLFRSGLFARMTRAATRIGHADAREGAAAFYTVRVPPCGRSHTVDRMLSLIEGIGLESVRDMRLVTPSGIEGNHLLEDAPRGRLVVFAPTSRWPGKQWPAERFADVADALLDEDGVTVAIVGAQGEREQCSAIFERLGDHPRLVDLIGRTSVGQLMWVIERSRLVVANDSAALHMAVGFDRELVGLFGPTDVSRVGPYRRDADVLQHVSHGETLDHKNASAGRDLMKRISVAEVLDACRNRLSRSCARTPA